MNYFPYFGEGVALGPGSLLVLAHICNKDLCAKNCNIFPTMFPDTGREGAAETKIHIICSII